MTNQELKDKLLTLTAEFTWDFGQNFVLETEIGIFRWSDPNYSGDNTIRPCAKDSFGRSKGIHFIEAYCGRNFVVVQ